jgi:hypothetical protein
LGNVGFWRLGDRVRISALATPVVLCMLGPCHVARLPPAPGQVSSSGR